MDRQPASTKWDTKGLAYVGACCGWLLVFAHEAYRILVSLEDGSHRLDPFAHLEIDPFTHVVLELVIGGLAGALLFASAAEIRNRLMRTA
jgi:hypothetical protein